MHKECAEFASQTCPFLSGQKLEYSNRPGEHKDAIVITVEMAPRPDTMFIMRTYTKKVRADSGGAVDWRDGIWVELKSKRSTRGGIRHRVRRCYPLSGLRGTNEFP